MVALGWNGMNGDQAASGFSFSRVHPLEWLAGLCGIALICALIMPWSGGKASSDSPGLLGVLLLLNGVFAFLLPFVVASSPRTNVPIVYETFLWTVTLLLTIVLLVKLAFPPDGGFDSGFWLALGATLVASLSLWRSVGRER
ncbi:MAG TPA: hypothetical protein P5138_01185 [Solirubrobacterales bacterium]|nr:hypothetical protein [Solirubrobacterales bacterium]